MLGTVTLLQCDYNSVHSLHKSGMMVLKVVEVLQYNGVNLKVISTKKTTVKMSLLHYNTPVKYDFHFWVQKLLMR